MIIRPLALLPDTYAWLLYDEGSKPCAVVDPSEAEEIRSRVILNGLDLRWILVTHHHSRHIGGVQRLKELFPEAEVICSAHDKDRVPCVTKTVEDNEEITVLGRTVQCMLVPGHTLGSIAYYFASEETIFTGDTLTLAGCGRVLEGTPEQMYTSLLRLKELPTSTKIYCDHEYTERNLSFARSLRFDIFVDERMELTHVRRRFGDPSIPDTVYEEKFTNPFFQANNLRMQETIGHFNELRVFKEMLRRRDRYWGWSKESEK